MDTRIYYCAIPGLWFSEYVPGDIKNERGQNNYGQTRVITSVFFAVSPNFKIFATWWKA